MTAVIQAQGLGKRYGQRWALTDCTLAIPAGRVVGLVGPNGAGKTTTLRTISGLVPLRGGDIKLNGSSLKGVPAHHIAGMGVAQSPEGRRVFPRMSVLENLEMGAFARGAVEQSDLDRVFDLFPRLKERIDQKAGTMSGGEQQMLAIGRALMAHPTLLLLDEPSMGLAPILIEKIFEVVQEINKQGTTVLLVEQNALMALAIADRGYVLQTGEIVLADTGAALLKNEQVRKAYLGEA